MATQTVFFSGTFKWAKLNEKNAQTFVDKNTGGEDKGPFCSVDFTFDNKDDLKAFKAFKTRNTIKIDDETGEQFVQFRRYLNHKTYPQFGGVPEVKIRNEDGTNTPFTDLIGNGTKGTIKLSVYDHAYGTACRLDGALITKLVPYEREGKTDEEPKTETKVFNDAIPF